MSVKLIFENITIVIIMRELTKKVLFFTVSPGHQLNLVYNTIFNI